MNIDKNDFPLLQQSVTYFDNAATTPKPQVVIDAVTHYLSTQTANPGRGSHSLSLKSSDLIKDTREKISHFLNLPSTQRIVFTKSSTESINLIAHSLLYRYKQTENKPTLIISVSEHHANFLPWVRLHKEHGFPLKIVPLLPTGAIDLLVLEHYLQSNSRAFVALTAMSNVTGIQTDLHAVSNLCTRYHAELLLDASQAIAHMPLDLQQSPCTYLTASAHKLYAPEGVGILVLPEEQLQTIEPLLLGGGSIRYVTENDFELLATEQRLEAGTLNTSGIVGFSAAIDFVNAISMNTIVAKENELGQYFIAQIKSNNLPLRLLVEPQAKSSSVFSFISKVHPHDISDELDKKNIAIRAGFHCAEPLHKALGVGPSVRVSLAFYNSKEEIDYFFEILSLCLKKYL